jgi:DNA-3-methyladenine glycosylase
MVKATDINLEPLSRRRIPLNTLEFARQLIGCVVVRRVGRALIGGRIVETEAYTYDDAASHSYRGQTPRNASMYLPPGHAYIYFIYGRSFMLNVSSASENIGDAVLIRALEPLFGLAQMRLNRPNCLDRDLARGPGRLTQALQIDLKLDGIDICRPGPLWIAEDKAFVGKIVKSPRIGIRHNVEALRRFYLADSLYISGRRGPI